MEEHLIVEGLQCEETRMKTFELLVKKHYQQVKGWIRRWVQDEAAVEDLTQETFLKAWQKCHTFKGASLFSSWLYRIAYRIALRFITRQKRWIRWMSGEEILEEIATALYSEPEALGKEIGEEIFRLLSPMQRLIWKSVFGEGLSYKETALRLGIQENTVKAHMYHIRRRLRDWLREE
ncbi:MAG: RNA polymerase sigma factor [Bacteroidia bacterium]|nr:RNA polymerase sigma factor [Bacteroidia bacterium]MDW8014409.1 RNA polymerase sigma factor [Bacteroidia bacterium]